MIDVETEVDAIRRQVSKRPGPDGQVISALARRRYDAAAHDVWRALTDPDRVRRWFLPIGGDLRESGAFQTQGNAGGVIRRCEAPRLLEVTWGAETSVVQLRLSGEGNGDTILELEHSVPLETAQSGAGCLFVGPGWDSAMMALGGYLRGEVHDDPVATASSLEAQRFARQALFAWVAAVEASGTATAEEIAVMTQAALPHWAPDL